ncbi:hypothetical protein CsatB_027390 [Cannabis sativa]
MGIFMRSLSTLFVLLLLLLSTEMGPRVAEGKTCEAQSRRFTGPCPADRICGNVCRTEGFSSGHCRDSRRRCFCTKDC